MQLVSHARLYSAVAVVLLVLTLAACQSTSPADSENHQSATEGFMPAEDLYIVDCLLPGQVRRVGGASYLSARRPIRTTVADCRLRGGEYVAYDRADYRSALNVWLPRAEQGDAEAQNYVGEIFEKGLGQEPDYVAARTWYEKAARSGLARAQINLGYLYEKGLGVDTDIARALNYYREAAGLEDDDLVLDSEAQHQLAEAKATMEKQLRSAQVQTQYLDQQITQLKTELAKQTEQARARQPQPDFNRDALAAAEQEIAALSELYLKAEQDRTQLETELQSMEVAYRRFSDENFLAPTSLQQSSHTVVQDINFGRYFALIIGNQDYLFLDDLRSPVHDAQALQTLLEDKYGFSTLLVANATEKNILNTINDFYSQIGENDNLLIYYAGHGNISRSETSRTERGYWLPVDAGSDNISNWINNSVISDHLDRLRARSVLVISDSCYAGYLGSEKSPFLFGLSANEESEKAIRAGIARRSRVVISSGGERPVLDGSNRNHSVFASALIEALAANEEALRDANLFAQLSVNLRKRAPENASEPVQIPEMKPVRSAGHEGGTFYFVPVD